MNSKICKIRTLELDRFLDTENLHCSGVPSSGAEEVIKQNNIYKLMNKKNNVFAILGKCAFSDQRCCRNQILVQLCTFCSLLPSEKSTLCQFLSLIGANLR